MKILAVADVHSPRFLDEFTEGLARASKPDVFLMAGDMIHRGKADEIEGVLDAIETRFGTDFPIVACFGNEEYSEIRKSLVGMAGDRIEFLDEKSSIIEADGMKVGVVGTQGSLDKATNWQRRHIPSIKRIFQRRAARASSLLKNVRKKVDRTILLMHYSPCLETCAGEETKAFAWLGSRKFYKVVQKRQPDLVIHGHVHNASTHEARIGTSLVRNVAFPAVGSVTELELWA
ncbi:MAG: metallophosphoesterase [Candidatus Thorarchaeota archaeon]|nr:MAG: metallophosphoesterase [Candidatus Thorarchaeota archaeon]